MNRELRTALFALASLSGAACAASGRYEQGAVMGMSTRASDTAASERRSASTMRGAILGASVGGATGANISRQMDHQAEALRQLIPAATVVRIGEGIALTFASVLLYGPDSDSLRIDASLDLRTLAASLREYPATTLLIVGHTDALGTSAYNQDLSSRRAASAMRYLGDFGVLAGRVASSGRGDLEPLGSNASETGRQLNRRVEVAIYANDAARLGAR